MNRYNTFHNFCDNLIVVLIKKLLLKVVGRYDWVIVFLATNNVSDISTMLLLFAYHYLIFISTGLSYLIPVFDSVLSDFIGTFLT